MVSRAIIASKYGKALVAVRDAESRMRFLGYRVENYKLFVFVVSAVIAGIAGALYVPQVGIINPSEFAPANSIEAAIWVAVGGRGTLIGAAIGAIAVNFAKTYFTGAFPEYWLYGLGLLFVLATLFLPKGLLGLALKSGEPEAARGRLRRRRRGGRRAVSLRRDGAIRRSPRRCSISTGSACRSTAIRRCAACRWCFCPARCARSSAPTAPARRR